MPVRSCSTGRILLGLGGVLATQLLHACATTPSRAGDFPPYVEAEGDWDDVHAVLAGVLPRVRLVSDPPDVDTAQRYECDIHSLRYGPGCLSLQLLDSHLIRIDAQIGRFGEPYEEQWVERALAARFSQIKGDRAAPISIPPRRPAQTNPAP